MLSLLPYLQSVAERDYLIRLRPGEGNQGSRGIQRRWFFPALANPKRSGEKKSKYSHRNAWRDLHAGSFGNRHLATGCPATTVSFMGKSTPQPHPTSPPPKLKCYQFPSLSQTTAGWPESGRSSLPWVGGCGAQEGWKSRLPSEKSPESQFQLRGIASSISRDNPSPKETAPVSAAPNRGGLGVLCDASLGYFSEVSLGNCNRDIFCCRKVICN